MIFWGFFMHTFREYNLIMRKCFILFAILCVILPLAKAQIKTPWINNIKLEVPNLLYGDYSFAVERKVMKNTSVSFRLGYLQPFNHLFKKYDIKLDGNKSGIDASMQYRFYLAGKKRSELLGFYFAPYLRYASLSLDFIDEIQFTPFSVSFTYSNIGAGLQLGIQKQLKGKSGSLLNHIVYDFHFIGGGFDRHTLSMRYQEMKDPDEYNYGAIEEEIRGYFDKFPFLSRKLKFGYLNNKLGVTLPLVLPGLRTGFSIGYHF